MKGGGETPAPDDGPGAATGVRRCDAIVIGAGQGGVPLAGAFARAGRRVVLIERRHVGGSCVNEGCTPTKTMIASARAAYAVQRAGAYGVRVWSDGIDMAAVRDRTRGIVEKFRAHSEGGLDRAGVELLRGYARFIGSRTLEVTAEGNAERLTADVIVIDTGASPAIPPIPGLDAVPFLTSRTALQLGELPDHLLVLGGGYVGVEFAQMFRRFGSKVTMLQREAQLLPREDADVAAEVLGILREDGIEVLLEVAVESVEESAGEIAVPVRGPNGILREVRGSHLLVATGRVPETADLDLAAAGVETDARGYIRVDERLQTSARGIYAIGDVKGGPAFTHVSYDDYRILRRNLLDGGSATTEERILPYTVFMDPQLGRVGMSEREAAASGRAFRVATLPMNRVARAIEVGETRGFMKAIVDTDTDAILGAAILGLEGGEIAAVIQVAMMGGLPYTALRDGMFAHPTIAESLNNLFMTLDRVA